MINDALLFFHPQLINTALKNPFNKCNWLNVSRCPYSAETSATLVKTNQVINFKMFYFIVTISLIYFLG